ncbi:RNA-binding (RRM/RBD/RNP motifs) family protein [Striga hermonthica]|uniref:Splicing factor 3B subunit 4 n=1 Tax=Striga hermonthica TaxID=68872 RepID=A0A9N7NRN2_STRHE|nr:RNA-binding (RRM/RBD/RNP motifs) family protein [Striga hermonthica]
MTTRIAPGVGANLLGQHSAERNQDATVYVGNLEPKATEEILWELFVQAGPVVNVYVPKDRVTNAHQGYGFVEFRSEEDADYAIKVLNMIKLYGKAIRVNKASQDKKSVDVGANLFIGNLDPDVDEKLLYDTFSAFGVIVTNPKIMRDPETGNSRGFGFISYDSFDASDAAIETMNGQYLCNRQITVSYAYKKDTKGERHGTPAERLLAANSSNNAQRSRPHTMFASGPPTQQMFASGTPTQQNGTVVRPPFANGTVPSAPIRMPPPPPQSAYQQLWRPPPPPQQLGGGGPHPMHQQPPMMMHMTAQPPPPPPQQMGGVPHPMMHMSQPPPQQMGGGPHPMMQQQQQQQQPMMMHMTQPPPQPQ